MTVELMVRFTKDFTLAMAFVGSIDFRDDQVVTIMYRHDSIALDLLVRGIILINNGSPTRIDLGLNLIDRKNRRGPDTKGLYSRIRSTLKETPRLRSERVRRRSTPMTCFHMLKFE